MESFSGLLYQGSGINLCDFVEIALKTYAFVGVKAKAKQQSQSVFWEVTVVCMFHNHSVNMFQLFFFFSLRSELKKSLEFAIGRTTSSTPRVWSVFWSCHQRFFKQLWWVFNPVSGLLGTDITTKIKRYLTKHRSNAHTSVSFAVHINKKATAQIRKPFIYLK